MVLGVLAYSDALGTFFLGDDFVLIASVRQDGPLAVWTRGAGGFFRPVISEANPHGFTLKIVGARDQDLIVYYSKGTLHLL